VSTQEGLPRGTLEAMAAGLPVIVSLIRGHVDLVEDGQSGLQVELGDVERLVEAMNELGLSASLRRAMGEEARKQVAMYALPEVVVRMDDIYRRFLPEGDTR
jgi:glycosyltransferase EpsD